MKTAHGFMKLFAIVVALSMVSAVTHGIKSKKGELEGALRRTDHLYNNFIRGAAPIYYDDSGVSKLNDMGISIELTDVVDKTRAPLRPLDTAPFNTSPEQIMEAVAKHLIITTRVSNKAIDSGAKFKGYAVGSTSVDVSTDSYEDDFDYPEMDGLKPGKYVFQVTQRPDLSDESSYKDGVQQERVTSFTIAIEEFELPIVIKRNPKPFRSGRSSDAYKDQAQAATPPEFSNRKAYKVTIENIGSFWKDAW